MKATKKPVVIDYFPLIGEKSNYEELKAWMSGFGDSPAIYLNDTGGEVTVNTLEGTSYAITSQDVVIRGVRGEYYPCKKDIFFETYTTSPV